MIAFCGKDENGTKVAKVCPFASFAVVWAALSVQSGNEKRRVAADASACQFSEGIARLKAETPNHKSSDLLTESFANIKQ